MADFDLKILFGVDVNEADFGKVNQELEKIQAQAKKLQESLATGPNQQNLWENFTQFNKVSETINNIKRLGQTIEDLTKQQNNVANLAKNLGDIGKTIQQAFDESKLNLIRRYKDELNNLQNLINQRATQSEMARAMAERAARMGNVESAQLYSRLATMRGIEAGQALAAATQLGAPAAAGGGAGAPPITPPAIPAGAGGGAGGGDFLTVLLAALSRGSWGPIQEFLKRWGPLATTIGIAYQAPKLIQGADQIIRMPERGEGAMTQFIRQISEDATAGRVFDLLSIQTGATPAGRLEHPGMLLLAPPHKTNQQLEQALNRRLFTGDWYNITQDIYSIFNYLRLKPHEISFIERFKALQKADRERIGWIVNLGGETLKEMMDETGDAMQEFGILPTVRMMRSGFTQGISRRFMYPFLRAIQEQGLRTDLDPSLMVQGFSMGLAPEAMRQMLRVAHFEGSPFTMLRMAGLIETAGLTRLPAVRAFSEAVAANLAAQPGVPDVIGAGEVLARSISAFTQEAGNIPQPALAQSGITMAQAMQQSVIQPFNITGASIEMALVSMGIDSPLVRLQLRRMIAVNPAGAARVIERLTGGRVSAQDASRAIGFGLSQSIRIAEGLITPQESAAFAGEGIALGPSLLVPTGQIAGGAGAGQRLIQQLTDLGQGLTMEAPSPTLKSPAMRFGADILAMEEARAIREAGLTQALDDMGEAILAAIRQGFIKIGQQIIQIASTKSYQDFAKSARAEAEQQLTAEQEQKLQFFMQVKQLEAHSKSESQSIRPPAITTTPKNR